MTGREPTHPWIPLQILAGRVSSVESMHSCIDLSLRPSPARFSRSQGHGGPQPVIQ
jgi:hypothetical protein